MTYNVDPATGKRRYKKKDRRTPRERMADDGYRGLWFMRLCKTCNKAWDREELLDDPWADECSLCRRRKERIREGLTVSATTPKQQRSVAAKQGARFAKARREAGEQALVQWQRDRREELLGQGVKSWEVYGRLLEEASAKRRQLGLPPSESPHAV